MYNAEIDWEIEEIKIMRYLSMDRWKIKILKKEKIKEKLEKTSVKVRKIEETSRNVVSLVSKIVPPIIKDIWKEGIRENNDKEDLESCDRS